VPPRERVRAILEHLDRIDNTVQYSWFLEIAQTFLGFNGDRVSGKDCDTLCDAADRLMAQGDWEEQVLRRSHVEKIFLTNDFDDPLEGFDSKMLRAVPANRRSRLHLDKPATRERLAKATAIDVSNAEQLQDAIAKLFRHFIDHGAKACAISLPPDFTPRPVSRFDLTIALANSSPTAPTRRPSTRVRAAPSGCSPRIAASSICRST